MRGVQLHATSPLDAKFGRRAWPTAALGRPWQREAYNL